MCTITIKAFALSAIVFFHIITATCSTIKVAALEVILIITEFIVFVSRPVKMDGCNLGLGIIFFQHRKKPKTYFPHSLVQLSPHSPNRPGIYLPPRVYVAHQKLDESAMVQLSIVSPLYSKGNLQASPSTVLHPEY